MANPHANKPERKTLYCPSAPAESGVAHIFGVVGGTADAPRVDYLAEPVPLTEELAALTDGVRPEEVYRLTSPCQEKRCTHFTGHDCSLGARLVREHHVVTDKLPPCSIRPSCRWFQERGGAACLRCPQVVTHIPEAVPEAHHEGRSQRRLPIVQQ
jgi:hypothetical protein